MGFTDLMADMQKISIHALREEGDTSPRARSSSPAYFYPRPPRGGRLALALDGREILHISIHALREEGDWPQRSAGASVKNFYPRPPRGGRHHEGGEHHQQKKFLSTPSARRAT